MGCMQAEKSTDNHGLMYKPHLFFLLGGPGCGKGTQAQNLVRDYKFKHLSTGDLLRQEQNKGGQLANTIDSFIKQGKLLPSELVVKLIKKGLSTYGNRRYLLDGFPRNFENWQELQKQLKDVVVVRNMIYFDCPTQTLIDRITYRGKTSGRADDNPETMKKRLATFETETMPIIQRFIEKGNCVKIDATKSKEQVYKQLREKLSALNVDPPLPAFMIFVLGGPGSGKGTQCSNLVKQYGFIHLSTGDLLRQQISAGTPLGKQIDGIIKQGKLVDSKLMVKIIQSKIQRNNYGGRYLLDGFPRGQQNMDVWQAEMAKWVNLKSVIYFQCPQLQLKRRLIQRGKTSGRSDDNQQSIKKRLTVFNQQTKPVVDFYSKCNKLHRFDASRSIDMITNDVKLHLESIGVFPKSQKHPKPKAIIVLGTSGSGKSTQCKTISAKFGFVHISSGALIREHMACGGAHAEMFAEYTRLGKLVPSEYVVKLVKTAFENQSWQGTFILDGFPRSKENLLKWNEQLGVEIDLDLMLLLQCSEEVALQRLQSRNAGRTDDNPTSIKQKSETYHKQTLPVIEQFTKKQGFIHKINANENNEQIYKAIVTVLHSRNFKEI